MESNDSVGWSHFTHQSSSLILVVPKLFAEPERTYLHNEVLHFESRF